MKPKQSPTNGRKFEFDPGRGLSKKDIYRLARPSARELADDREAKALADRLTRPQVKVKKLGPVWVNYEKGKALEHPDDRD